MFRIALLLLIFVGSCSVAAAQNFPPHHMIISTSNTDYQISNVFGNVSTFNFRIEIDAPIGTGVYVNPDIVSVSYQVTGSLAAGTPSGFTNFNLQRTMTGQEFYDQGSSLSFEVSPAAVLGDGIQIAELVGNGVVFSFNGREIDNGRFHPALFELNADGTGRLQNSNNIHTLDPLNEVTFGEEYITDLTFDPGNLYFTNIPPHTDPGGGNGGTVSLAEIVVGLLLLAFVARRRRKQLISSTF
jgi:hypothetical protein